MHGQTGFARTHRCPCELCRVAVRTYDKRLRFEKAYGVTRRVNPDRAREHCRRLSLRGVSFGQIAQATDGKVAQNQVARLVEGHKGVPVQYVWRATAEALMAVTYEDCLVYDGKVHAFAVKRRLEALMYMGYGTVEIAEGLGVTTDNVARLLARDVVKRSTVKKVANLYDRWWRIPGPSERARWRAYRNDYCPPMAWDEGALDDPFAEPDRSVIACVVDNCGRVVTHHSLCAAHIRRCLELDGFRSSERFRMVVMRLGRQRLRSNWGDLECTG